MKDMIVSLCLFIFCFISLGCEEDSELIVAKAVLEDEISGYTRTLQFFKDSTFQFSESSQNRIFKSDSIIKGKYSIVNDTIYLLNKIYNREKAILKNGYLELLSTSPLKFNLLKNNSNITSELYTDDHSDFTFFTYSKEYFKNDFIGKGKNSSVSGQEIEIVKNLIQKSINENRDKFYSNLNESDYYKQCLVIVNDKNEKELSINCLSKKSEFPLEWKHKLINVKDGGDSYFFININLTKKKITLLIVNGEA